MRLFRIPIIHRYFVKYFFYFFITSTLIVTSLFVLFVAKDIIQIGIQKKIPIVYLLEFIFFSSLWVFSLTIPMSSILGTIMAISQFQDNSEIIALRSCGQSLFQIFKPIFKCSILLFLLLVVHQQFLVSYFNHKRNQAIHKISVYNPASMIAKKKFVTLDKSNQIIRNIYVGDEENIDGKILLKNIQIRNIDISQFPSIVSSILIAKKGYQILKERKICSSGNKNCSYKKWKAIRLKIGHVIQKDPLTSKLQIIDFTKGYFDLHLNEVNNTKDIELVTKFENATGYTLLKQYKKYIKKDIIKARKILLEFHQRIALPFSIILFTFLGCYLPIVSRRSGKSAGLGVASIVIFVYFMIYSLSGVLIETFKAPVLLSAWLANFVLLVTCIFVWKLRQNS